MSFDRSRVLSHVIYALDERLSDTERSRLASKLAEMGATAAQDDSQATHHITYHGADPRGHALAVTLEWVDTVYKFATAPEERFFSPDGRLFLSGKVICTSGMSTRDERLIADLCSNFGGQYRSSLTREVTHLVCAAPEGSKFQKASSAGAGLGMFIVRPQWLWHALATGICPDAADFSFDSESTPACTPPIASWLDTLVIYIDQSLASSPVLDAFKARLTGAGATVSVGEHSGGVEGAQIVVCTDRSDEAFWKAQELGKTVASLDWLLAVIANQVFIEPTVNLLYAPLPSRPHAQLAGKTICAGAYRYLARETVIRWVTMLGARYSGCFNSATDLLVSRDLDSAKAMVAMRSNRPVVSHLWLIDAFAAWSRGDPVLPSTSAVRYVPGTQEPFTLPALGNDLERWTDLPEVVIERYQQRAPLSQHTSSAATFVVEDSQSIDAAVGQELTCGICLELLVEPLMTRCQHLLCAGCLVPWLRMHASCPTCRGPASLNDVDIAPLPIRRIIDALWQNSHASLAATQPDLARYERAQRSLRASHSLSCLKDIH